MAAKPGDIVYVEGGAYGIYVNGTTDPTGTLSNLTITGNQVYDIESNDPGGAGTYGFFDAVGNEVLIASYPDVTNTNIQLDYNLYYTRLGKNDPSAFTWNNNSFSGFGAYRNGTKEDAHSQFANPNFVNAATANFALAAGSPALGAGTSKSLWYAPKNFNGHTRTLPPDIGAY